MIITANIWKPEEDDGTLFEDQRIQVERTDEDEVAVHLRLASDEWGVSFYLDRVMAGAFAATLLAAAGNGNE